MYVLSIKSKVNHIKSNIMKRPAKHDDSNQVCKQGFKMAENIVLSILKTQMISMEKTSFKGFVMYLL